MERFHLGKPTCEKEEDSPAVVGTGARDVSGLAAAVALLTSSSSSASSASERGGRGCGRRFSAVAGLARTVSNCIWR